MNAIRQLDPAVPSLFAAAASTTLARYRALASRKSYDAGQNVVAKGDSGTEVMFIVSGRATVTHFSSQGREVRIQTLEPGEFFGEYAAIDGLPRSTDVDALDDLEVDVLSGPHFAELVFGDATVARALSVRHASMLRLLTRRIYELTVYKASDRIRAEILKASVPASDNVAVISPAPKHADIAALVGTQRHVVTGEISRLMKSGLISREGSDLIIPDYRAFQMMVSANPSLDL